MAALGAPATRSEVRAVYSSGAWDPEFGIQRDAQLRTYQAIAEDHGDGTTFHLLRNDHWVVDSRIHPRRLQAPQVDAGVLAFTIAPRLC